MIALEIVSSADAVRDKNSAASFVAQAHEKTEVVVDPKEPEASRPAGGHFRLPSSTNWSYIVSLHVFLHCSRN